MDKNRNYVDLHTHTRLSDGKLSSLELIHEAMKNGIKVLAITDHNRMLSKERLEELEKMVEDKLILLRATEVSCKYKLMEREVELHIVALFPDKSVDLHPFLSFLEKNIGCDRRSYIEDILEKLRSLNIDIGSYQDLQKKYGYIGRPQVALELALQGYVSTADEAMDKYIGNHGQKLAFVENKNKNNFCMLEEVLEQIYKAKGLAVLAHLYYYNFTSDEITILLKDFQKKAGFIGGMETEYHKYSEEQRCQLRQLADKYNLFHSAGSDYHGIFESDGLDNYFSFDIYNDIIKRWEVCYKDSGNSSILSKNNGID